MGKAKRTAEQKAVLESARKLAPSKRPRSDAGAPVSTPRSPRARRFRRPSGALIAPPPQRCTRNGRCSCSDWSGRPDGDWWKSRRSTSTGPTGPTGREATAAAPSLPILCTDAHGTPARTHNFQPTALWGRLGMNLPLPPQRTTRLPRPRRCLPLRIRRDMPPRAHARSTRPSTRPLSAVRRCRHGCECQR